MRVGYGLESGGTFMGIMINVEDGRRGRQAKSAIELGAFAL
jgi:hypothetical protein